MAKKFTGFHMVMVMLAFFGTVIAVNLVMARYALSTFGGTVVANSYVASQEYNGWLAKARAQKALGWKTDFAMGPARRIAVETIEGATISALAKHPVGRAPDVRLRFVAIGAGQYRAVEALPTGRWNVHLTITRGNDQAKLIESLG